MEIDFCPLASGSNGNSIYIGTEKTKILIDAGQSGIKIQKSLENIGVRPNELSAIFVTHEHCDHTQGVGILSRRFDIPVYATKKTWYAMEKSLGKIKEENKKIIKSENDYILGDIKVHPFKIPHDANEPVAYNVFFEDYKISVATDLGHINDFIKNKLYASDVLLIESNHDVQMLLNGPYPHMLKERILSDIGHISNKTCGDLLSEIVCDKVKFVYLGHLSQDNNEPILAFNTVKDILLKRKNSVNKNLQMSVAKRGITSQKIKLHRKNILQEKII